VDETFNRETRRLEEGKTIRDLPTYCTAWRAWSSFNRWGALVIWKMKNGFGVDRPVYPESIFYGGRFNTYLKVALSRFGPPAAVVDVTRTALNAVLTGRVTFSVVVL
jgi:hypothetical protein